MEKTNVSYRKKPKITVAEASFDVCYLLSLAALGTALAVSGNALWSAAAFVLLCGDALHLAPRISRAAGGAPSVWEERGKLAASVTMTVFYLLLWFYAANGFADVPIGATAAVCALAAIRILLCLLPKSFENGAPFSVAIVRNVPFVALGAAVAALYGTHAGTSAFCLYVCIAVAISFVCYVPVVLFARRYPKLGMLMIPKSCAYVAIVALGLMPL